MKKLSHLIPLFAFTPLFALAQVANYSGFEEFMLSTMNFINAILVPFVFAVALIVFLWGVFKTFILGGGDEEKQREGKQLMMYAIMGFVVMVSVWGIVNLIGSSLGLTGQSLPPLPYVLPPV